MFKRIFESKEIKAMRGVLDEIEYVFLSESLSKNTTSGVSRESAFNIVRNQIEDAFKSHPKLAEEKMRSIGSPRIGVYTLVANISANHLESGQYHLHRGFLNPLGPGQGFLDLYDMAVIETVRLDVVTEEFANNNRKILIANIAQAG